MLRFAVLPLLLASAVWGSDAIELGPDDGWDQVLTNDGRMLFTREDPVTGKAVIRRGSIRITMAIKPEDIKVRKGVTAEELRRIEADEEASEKARSAKRREQQAATLPTPAEKKLQKAPAANQPAPAGNPQRKSERADPVLRPVGIKAA